MVSEQKKRREWRARGIKQCFSPFDLPLLHPAAASYSPKNQILGYGMLREIFLKYTEKKSRAANSLKNKVLCTFQTIFRSIFHKEIILFTRRKCTKVLTEEQHATGFKKECLRLCRTRNSIISHMFTTYYLRKENLQNGTKMYMFAVCARTTAGDRQSSCSLNTELY